MQVQWFLDIRGSVARATLVVKPTSQFYGSVIRMDGETLQGNMGFTPPHPARERIQ